MTLRDYTPADCPEMARLFYDTVHWVNARDYSPEQLDAWADGHPDLERWDASFREHTAVVAQEGGIIVGFGDMSEDGYLDRLYVHKDFQGRGVAGAICDELERRVNAPRYTTHASITARGFFLRRGYRVVREQQVERHGVWMTNFVMERENMIAEKIDMSAFSWTREPKSYKIEPGRVEIVTKPHTDLWQRTYYHFQNDNAPVLQMETGEKFFSFTVRTDFSGSCRRFDQCGIVMYLDSENWLKASVEYENGCFQHLGSVVTNQGWSDWATTAIDASIKEMWYRLSRREDDYCIECSYDAEAFSQMRVCHMHKGGGQVRFGIYACSPEDSSFKAVFTDMAMTECQWRAHDGQQPDPPARNS